MTFPKNFFLQDAPEVAPQLLGHILCRKLPTGEIKKGVIVETEAYMSHDPACHAYKGETIRNRSLFLDGGYSYVYFIYGMYYCLNVVTGKKGDGQAVLIRALDMIDDSGVEEKIKRGKKGKYNFFPASGPGKLCRYLCINKEHNGLIFAKENSLWIENCGLNGNFSIACSERVGISVGKELLWRFFVAENRAVS